MARDVTLTPKEVAKPVPSRVKKYLWGFGGLVLLGGGAYLGGRLQVQHELSVATSELQISRERQVEQQRAIDELEARRRIHLSIIELDANNFGTAQTHLRAAAALLATTPGTPEVASLATALKTLELAPSLDAPAQRAALTALASKFDSLRPPPTLTLPPSVTPPPVTP
jgi:hypothetical protein